MTEEIVSVQDAGLTSVSSSPSFSIDEIRGVAGGSRTVRLRCSGDRRRSFYRLCASSSSRAESIVMEGDREKFGGGDPPIKLLIVEMGVGYDQHGQDITVAAMRACRDAISANSIPAFRRGSIPGVSSEQMKLLIKLGVPRATQQFLDIERVKSVFPYGQIIDVEIMDGGMICSSGVYLEAMGDKNDDCYVVNAAVYVGY